VALGIMIVDWFDLLHNLLLSNWIYKLVYLCGFHNLCLGFPRNQIGFKCSFLSHIFWKIGVHYIRLQGVVGYLLLFVLLILFICLTHGLLYQIKRSYFSFFVLLQLVFLQAGIIYLFKVHLSDYLHYSTTGS